MDRAYIDSASATTPAAAQRSGGAMRRRFRLALLEAPPLTRAELAWVTGLLALVAIALYGGQVLNGGLYSDDWSLAGGVAEPAAYGHETALGFLIDQAGARITAAFYWFATHELFGLHAKAYLAVAAGLAVVLSAATYALLRELGVERLLALAVALLMLAFPPADAVRVWTTPALSQLALAAWSVGALLALRAFAASGRRRTVLHAGSVGLYVLGLSITEMVAPFVVLVSPLLYLTAAPWRTAARRWLVDLALAALAAALVASLTTRAPERKVGGLADWWAQAKRFTDQSVTLFSHAFAPSLHGVRWIVVAASLAIVGAAGFLAWSQRSPAARAARRWLAAAGIAVVGIVAGYAVYLPADSYYFPLQQGLAARVNIGVAAPFAVLLVALAVLAGLVLFQWTTETRRVAVTAAAVYAALLFGAFIQDLRTDLRVWERSADEQYRTLNVIKEAVPDPPDAASMFVFGEGGVVTPGLPVFYHSWELTGALRATYDEGDVSGVPIIEGRGVVCEADEVLANVVGTPQVLLAAPYDSAMFVDIATGRASTIRSAGQCRRLAPTYLPGPYAVPDAPAPPDPT